jgi:elongation factor G
VQKVEGRFVRQTGGRGQFGHVVINVEPAPGEGFDFVNEIKGGAIPTEFIPAVEQGIEEALQSGVKAGYPMVDVRVELIDGSYHDVDSSEMAFKIAGSMALRRPPQGEAVSARACDGRRGRHARGVPRRRDRRPLRGRGKVQGQEPRGNALACRLSCPLGEMFGYATDLRSPTQGRASYTMQFERYEEVPRTSRTRSSSTARRARGSQRVAIFPGSPANYFQHAQTPTRHLKERDVQGEVRSR